MTNAQQLTYKNTRSQIVKIRITQWECLESGILSYKREDGVRGSLSPATEWHLEGYE